MSERILILGATSGIAEALCRVLAARGCSLILAGRHVSRLESLAEELTTRFSGEFPIERFEALDWAGHDAFVERCFSRFQDGLEGVVLCYGVLPSDSEADDRAAQIRRAFDVNLTSPAVLLESIARRLEERGRGYIAALSSVAGDRGRQSNYVYGASKAGLDALLQGLRNRLAPRGVHVLTVKPGWVATRMTDGIIDPSSPLVVSPEIVAVQIDRAIRRRRNQIYTPRFWGPVMVMIRLIPESIFKRLRL